MAGGSGSPLKAVLYAFAANLGIAIAKTWAALHTGSSSMVAEAIHSFADSGNQLLLLLGMRGAQRPPDATHPLGYGKLSYFWSFIVALVLFTLGGVYSLYEGWHKLADPVPPEQAWVALTVLGVAIVLEAASLYGCLQEVNKIRGEQSLLHWLDNPRSSELIVVFGEDIGALLGLFVAFGFVWLADATGDGRYDAYGSMAIGVVLLAISVFVGIRVRALLIGRSAGPEVTGAIERLVADDPAVRQVFNVITFQLGPKMMLAAKIRLDPSLTIDAACRSINAIEEGLKQRYPEIGWCFIEPDIAD